MFHKDMLIYDFRFTNHDLCRIYTDLQFHFGIKDLLGFENLEGLELFPAVFIRIILAFFISTFKIKCSFFNNLLKVKFFLNNEKNLKS